MSVITAMMIHACTHENIKCIMSKYDIVRNIIIIVVNYKNYIT